MMDQLGITSLRPEVNERVPGSANYDEAKANPYPALPDPLTLKKRKEGDQRENVVGSAAP
jgi:hypothetical protein